MSDEKKYMVMLNAYFDETGHGDDPNTKYLGIVGCGQREEDWIELEKEWKSVLDSENLPYFHMSEFAQSSGIFKSWKGDEPRRRELYGELWKIITEASPFVIGGFVKLEDYKFILNAETQSILVDAYYVCYLHCLATLIDLFTNNRSVSIENLSTIFDYKKGFMDYAFTIYDRIMMRYPTFVRKISPPVFRDMRIILPLQVADIIAYESYKEFEEQSKGINRRPKRWGLIQLENLIKASTNVKSFTLGDEDSFIKLYSPMDIAKISFAVYQSRLETSDE